MKIIRKFTKNDYCLYYLDCDGRVALQLLPAGTEPLLTKQTRCEPLLHAFVRGDVYGGQFTNGLSRRLSETTKSLTVDGIEEKDGKILTRLSAKNGMRFEHEVTLLDECAEVRVTAVNASEEDKILEYLTSFALGGITPVVNDEDAGSLKLVRLRSFWSAEGRREIVPLEQLALEPVAGYHMDRIEKFGSVGSMPIRGFFPRACLQDDMNGITWGFDLDAPCTWQMECVRMDRGVSMTGGPGDEDFGSWHRTLRPGECFTAPSARLTVCRGDNDKAFQRLCRAGKDHLSAPGEAEMPFIYNEYCTTGGNPTRDNILSIANRLKGMNFAYLVIDAGWFVDIDKDWGRGMGDWEISRERFPGGFKEVCDAIRGAGMIPGLWFEPEVVGPDSRAWNETEHLLKKNGEVLTVHTRRFWDMTDPWVRSYLREKVIGTLKEGGFGFIKVDYNDNIGAGADGDDGVGEQLRRNAEASLDFFREMRRELPGLVIENCSSGGTREESAFLRVSDMASFSDCMDAPEVPVIAANEHRVLLPEQEEIWAVLPASLSDDEMVYRIISTFYGRHCMSGSIYDLSEKQWDVVKAGTDFYKDVRHIIKNGETLWLTPDVLSYRKLTGSQVTLQVCGEEALLICHRFREDEERVISLPDGWKAESHYGNNQCAVRDGKLVIRAGGSTADAWKLGKA